jgi:NADH-quinone oxidoreductase subunit J
MPPVLGADPNWLVTLKGLANLWPLWLPLVVGGLAIYLLLPRPRAYPWVWGALAGVLALVLGGFLLIHSGALNAETVLFYAFSGIALIAGALLVTQHNPARAALSFALVVLSTCGLFLLLAAPFLMAATIIVYAGAIIVTFLFVIMLAQAEGKARYDRAARAPGRSTFTCFLVLWCLIYALTALTSSSASSTRSGGYLSRAREIPRVYSLQPLSDDLAVLGRAFRPTSWLYDSKGAEKEHVAGLGESLYTDHMVTVGLSGALLFVALVGAVAIANPKRTERSQP